MLSEWWEKKIKKYRKSLDHNPLWCFIQFADLSYSFCINITIFLDFCRSTLHSKTPDNCSRHLHGKNSVSLDFNSASFAEKTDQAFLAYVYNNSQINGKYQNIHSNIHYQLTALFVNNADPSKWDWWIF